MVPDSPLVTTDNGQYYPVDVRAWEGEGRGAKKSLKVSRVWCGYDALTQSRVSPTKNQSIGTFKDGVIEEN